MNLIESLPKNWEGKIILDPGARIEQDYYPSHVRQEWFQTNYPRLSEAEIPLDDSQFEELKSIDNYWKINAEKWRDEGFI